MPRARSSVRDMLLAIATMAGALLRGDAVHPVVGLLRDALGTRAELLAENALLRQQLLVLRRQVARPRVTAADRWWMMMAARAATAWREALLIVQPATLLRWHRELYRRW